MSDAGSEEALWHKIEHTCRSLLTGPPYSPTAPEVPSSSSLEPKPWELRSTETHVSFSQFMMITHMNPEDSEALRHVTFSQFMMITHMNGQQASLTIKSWTRILNFSEDSQALRHMRICNTSSLLMIITHMNYELNGQQASHLQDKVWLHSWTGLKTRKDGENVKREGNELNWIEIHLNWKDGKGGNELRVFRRLSVRGSRLLLRSTATREESAFPH